jgi:DNA replicative helicase MCM subunit Mcm2 (Cdc46/Mcm family)
VYQPYDKLLHGNRGKNDIYSVQFIKKYILYAKSRPAPVLTEEVTHLVFMTCTDMQSKAASYIKNEFANLRSKDDMKVI